MQQVLVTNAIHLNADETFKSFCHSLSLVRDGRLNLEGRFATAEFLSLYGNYVVTHHWENGLNYLYYDVLAGGFPLIHNAESLQDFGYYYPSWDAIAGGNCLLDALAHHGERLGAYRERANALLRQVDALNPENIRLHEQLLFEL
jgi:hypothetical protein